MFNVVELKTDPVISFSNAAVVGFALQGETSGEGVTTQPPTDGVWEGEVFYFCSLKV